MDEIRELLNEEIKSEIEGLSNLEVGTKEKAEAIDNLAALYKLRIDETKNEMELDEKLLRRIDDKEQCKRDELVKAKEIEEQVKDRRIGRVIEVAGIVVPMVFYAVWMKKGFKFEETGTFTSTTFRGLFNRFKPVK